MKKLLMASLALSTFAASILLFQMSSCKKANAQVPAAVAIQGLWIGTYTTDGQPNPNQQYFSFIIKPDGTMINDTKGAGQQHLALGAWSLTGDTLSCSFTCVYGLPSNIGVSETSKAYFDKTAGKLTSGVWKNVTSLNMSGTFTLTKVN